MHSSAALALLNDTVAAQITVRGRPTEVRAVLRGLRRSHLDIIHVGAERPAEGRGPGDRTIEVHIDVTTAA